MMIWFLLKQQNVCVSKQNICADSIVNGCIIGISQQARDVRSQIFKIAILLLDYTDMCKFAKPFHVIFHSQLIRAFLNLYMKKSRKTFKNTIYPIPMRLVSQTNV